jgi:hypothetical protein
MGDEDGVRRTRAAGGDRLMHVNSSLQEADVPAAPSFAETREGGVCSWIVFALVMVYTARIMDFQLRKVPIFYEVFHELAIDLPAMTLCMFSRAFLWGVAILAAAGLAKELLVRNRLVTLAVNGVHLVLLVATCWFLEAAFLMPLLHLLGSMGE